MNEQRIKILYLEDVPEVLETWLSFLQKTWGADCRGARSRERAIQLIEEGFQPDLVIFDRGILRYEDDEVDSKKAGDALYYYLCKRNIRTVVFSGDSDLEYIEPYLSNRPLGFFSKPDADSLRRAVELYKDDLNRKEIS